MFHAVVEPAGAPSSQTPSPEPDAHVGTHVRFQPSGTMRAAMWIAFGALLLSIVSLFLFAFLGGAPPGVLLWGLLVTPILAALAAIGGVFKIPSGESLRVDGKGVVIDRRRRGPLRIPPGRLSEGWLSPREKRVYLRTRQGDIYSARVTDQAAGQAMLERAGLDASKRTLRTRLGAVDFLNAMSWLVGPAVVMPLAQSIASALNMGGALGVPLAVLFFLLQFYLVRQTFGPAHIVIGADGIIVSQRFRTRFIPFDRIRSITTAADHVTLDLTDGTSVRARARHLDSSAQAAIQARVQDALAARRARSAEPSALAELDRAGRTAPEWRTALSGLLAQDRGYRAARLTREQILGVLENPAAPAARRIGAAIALTHSGDHEASSRIRVAAGSSANQRVRVALEKIAAGEMEDAAVDEAAEEEARRPPAAAHRR